MTTPQEIEDLIAKLRRYGHSSDWFVKFCGDSRGVADVIEYLSSELDVARAIADSLIQRSGAEPEDRWKDADERMASAYQAVGTLLDRLGLFSSAEGTALLDMLAYPEAPIPDYPWHFAAPPSADATREVDPKGDAK